MTFDLIYMFHDLTYDMTYLNYDLTWMTNNLNYMTSDLTYITHNLTYMTYITYDLTYMTCDLTYMTYDQTCMYWSRTPCCGRPPHCDVASNVVPRSAYLAGWAPRRVPISPGPSPATPPRGCVLCVRSRRPSPRGVWLRLSVGPFPGRSWPARR